MVRLRYRPNDNARTHRHYFYLGASINTVLINRSEAYNWLLDVNPMQRTIVTNNDAGKDYVVGREVLNFIVQFKRDQLKVPDRSRLPGQANLRTRVRQRDGLGQHHVG